MTRLKFWILIAISLFVLTTCQGNQTVDPDTHLIESESSTDTPVPEPTTFPTAQLEQAVDETVSTPTSAPTIVPPTLASETAVSPPIIENVTIEAQDGLILHATYYGPGGMAPFPGVILLHMLGSNRQVWVDNGFAEKLAANGYAVLALDMRGHGDSVGTQDWAKTEDDLLRVWSDFVGRDEVDAGKTAVFGASIGSNMALQTGANEPAIQTVILLSPGLDYRGVTTEDALEHFGDRPILIVASEEDTYAADSSRTLIDQAQGKAQLEMYNGAGHGTNMFTPQPQLADLLLDWVNKHLLGM